MPYSKVEESPAPPSTAPGGVREIHQGGRHYTGERYSYKMTSGRTVGHAIFRCTNCRALAVTEAGVSSLAGECGKCHQ